MRIAFVGKGGSGKTTAAALFADFLSYRTELPIYLIDADINMHLGETLGISTKSSTPLSNINVQHEFRKYIAGDNTANTKPDLIKKTTPPSSKTRVIRLHEPDNLLLKHSILDTNRTNTHLSVVGTYTEEGIGTSCYHNNLSIFENILTHSDDTNAVLLADMVAGTDAFANTLHIQFDVLVLIVEPTKRSIEVFEQYIKLMAESNSPTTLVVLGNKISSTADLDFIKLHIPSEYLLGGVSNDQHIIEVSRGIKSINSTCLGTQSMETFEKLFEVLKESKVSSNERYKKLCSLHLAYVSQAYIKERFGDLSMQIENNFDFEIKIKGNDK